MARYNDTAIIVDDQDSSIQYSGAWQHLPPAQGAVEYMLTKSGAGPAGLTATFKFTGTGVEVYGSQGSWDVYGVPVTTYAIDGKVVATYQTPIIENPYYTDHTLYFRSASLAPGEHQLVITTTNGTSPNMYWLDYIVYSPSATPASPPSQLQSPPSQIQPSQPPQQSSNPPSHSSELSSPVPQTHTSPSSSGSPLPSGTPTSPPSSGSPTTEVIRSSNGTAAMSAPLTAAPSSSSSDTASLAGAASSSSHTQAGPIAGGVVGGIILLVALAMLFFFFCRRKQRKVHYNYDTPPEVSQVETADGATTSRYDIVPFGSWREDDGGSVPPEKQVSSLLPPGSQMASETGATGIPSPGPFSGSSSEPYTAVASSPSTTTTSVSPASQHSLPLPSMLIPPTGVARQPQAVLTPAVVHHADSGVRFPTARPVVDVPPAYSRA